MIISKIVSVIFVGLLLSIGLWIACYILILKMYPRYSLELRHHVFSLLVTIATFVLYCSFSTVSATISGIENAFSSVKAVVLDKSKLADKLAITLASGSDYQQLIKEADVSISKALGANNELANYIKPVDFSQIEAKNITCILSADNLSVSEKSIQIIDQLFDTYVEEFTGTLKKTWWVLLITMLVVQIFYFGTMIYRAEKKSRVKFTNISNLLNTGMY